MEKQYKRIFNESSVKTFHFSRDRDAFLDYLETDVFGFFPNKKCSFSYLSARDMIGVSFNLEGMFDIFKGALACKASTSNWVQIEMTDITSITVTHLGTSISIDVFMKDTVGRFNFLLHK